LSDPCFDDTPDDAKKFDEKKYLIKDGDEANKGA